LEKPDAIAFDGESEDEDQIEIDEDGDDDQIDPRWAALKDLKKK
jgi:uncharacterized metal-binding protein YceD (DUF177 family)